MCFRQWKNGKWLKGHLSSKLVNIRPGNFVNEVTPTTVDPVPCFFISKSFSSKVPRRESFELVFFTLINP
jgi:hypothetical protein